MKINTKYIFSKNNYYSINMDDECSFYEDKDEVKCLENQVMVLENDLSSLTRRREQIEIEILDVKRATEKKVQEEHAKELKELTDETARLKAELKRMHDNHDCLVEEIRAERELATEEALNDERGRISELTKKLEKTVQKRQEMETQLSVLEQLSADFENGLKKKQEELWDRKAQLDFQQNELEKREKEQKRAIREQMVRFAEQENVLANTEAELLEKQKRIVQLELQIHTVKAKSSRDLDL